MSAFIDKGFSIGDHFSIQPTDRLVIRLLLVWRISFFTPLLFLESLLVLRSVWFGTWMKETTSQYAS